MHQSSAKQSTFNLVFRYLLSGKNQLKVAVDRKKLMRRPMRQKQLQASQSVEGRGGAQTNSQGYTITGIGQMLTALSLTIESINLINWRKRPK